MSKFQINDIKLDGSELFNDSETFLSELKDDETDQIVGGFSLSLSEESSSEASINIKLEVSGDADVTTTVYIPHKPICYPIKPIKPICWYPKPICDQKPFYPIKDFYYPCPVIL
ncbi:hypothetical protein Riv7116_0198 [Rivularia sp. PCC 7116]|uniref:hypothetical protein n=1 Tax=Rivularia sp. PCC 7116 TaxID=373994 RepID=UPI00029ECF55|nr:hypothetical protein [Rivularia sp. PCC 7116]AFY52806.1 hypothetical protein Riv7116_0198 [Rivularia sp. PCC 7116]